MTRIKSERENRICDLAEVLGCSYGEAERELDLREKKETPKATKTPGQRKARAPREKKPKQPFYTYKKVIKMARTAGKECMADNPDMQMEDVAYDLADCLLHDPLVLEAMKKEYYRNHSTYPSRQLMKEILADYVAEGRP